VNLPKIGKIHILNECSNLQLEVPLTPAMMRSGNVSETQKGQLDQREESEVYTPDFTSAKLLKIQDQRKEWCRQF